MVAVCEGRGGVMGRAELGYALYHGDAFITCGTINEISKETGLKKSTLYFYTSEKYKKRLINSSKGMCMIKIEGDDDN